MSGEDPQDRRPVAAGGSAGPDTRSAGRRFFNRTFSSFLLGVEWPLWRRLLHRHRVDARYWPRAALITLASLHNAVLGARERHRFDSRIAGMSIPSPLFVLGHWRSGTSYLYRLLATDDRFTFPTLYQVFFPSTFLTSEGIHPKLLGRFLPATRPYDGMEVRFDLPGEDELAVAVLTGLSDRMASAFPAQRERYERYLTLEDVTPDEIAAWSAALLQFLRKLCLRTSPALFLLKSPAHTAHVGRLIDLFPDARFIHVVRNPYDVFRSSCAQLAVNAPFHRLQSAGAEASVTYVLRRYRQVYDSFYRARRRVPDGRLHELRFEDLERDPVGAIEAAYRTLELPDFSRMRPRLEALLASAPAYRKNDPWALPRDLERAVGSHWRQGFEEWGYRR